MPGTGLPQLRALAISGASKIKEAYLPVSGCDALYGGGPQIRQTLRFSRRIYFSAAMIPGELSAAVWPARAMPSEGWLAEALGKAK